MGTNYRSRVSFNCDAATNHKVVTSLIDDNKQDGNGNHIANTMLNRFGESMKWTPEDIIEKLSKKYPDVMMRLDMFPEIGEPIITIYMGGVPVNGMWALDKFPTKAKMLAGLKSIRKKKAEDERLAKEFKLARLREQTKKLEDELRK